MFLKNIFFTLLIFVGAFGAEAYETTSFYGSLEKVTLNLNGKDIEKSQLLITSDSKKIIYNFTSFDDAKKLLTLSNKNLGYIVADLNLKYDAAIEIKQYDKKGNLITKASIEKDATTQLVMNSLSLKGYEEADKKINKIYKQVMKKHKDNKLFTKKLRASQRLWIKLKEANLEAVFPEEDKRLYYGSMYPLNKNSALEVYTLERIRFLKQFLEEY